MLGAEQKIRAVSQPVHCSTLLGVTKPTWPTPRRGIWGPRTGGSRGPQGCMSAPACSHLGWWKAFSTQAGSQQAGHAGWWKASSTQAGPQRAGHMGWWKASSTQAGPQRAGHSGWWKASSTQSGSQ